MNILQKVHKALIDGGTTKYAYFEISPTKMYVFIGSNIISILIVDNDLIHVNNEEVARLSDVNVASRINSKIQQYSNV